MALASIGFENLPRNSLLFVEEELGDIKRIFAQMVVVDAIAAGNSVAYITTGNKEDVQQQVRRLGLTELDKIKIIDNFHDRARLHYECDSNVCIVEGFSLMNIDIGPRDLVGILNTLLESSRKNSRMIIMTSDIGIISDQHERIIRAMADGIIQFTTVNEEDRISRYINIPKLNGKPLPEKNIPYALDDERIYIDTRERFG